MSAVGLIAYRFSDPDIPADVGEVLLPFNAQRFFIEIWHSAGVALSPLQVRIVFEKKSGLMGSTWREFIVDAVVSSHIGKIECLSSTLPSDIGYGDDEGNLSKRIRLLIDHEDQTTEHTIEFGRGGLPILLDKFLLSDEDRPSVPEATPSFAGDIARIRVDLYVSSPLAQVDLEFTLRPDRGGPQTTFWRRKVNLETNRPQHFIIDPVPPEVTPAPSHDRFNRYRLSAVFSSGGVSTSFSRMIWVGPVVPPGTISIRKFALSDQPIYEFDPPTVEYSDVWDRAIASVEIATSGYDPTSDATPATATLFFRNFRRPFGGGKGWVATAPIYFEPDGTGWAYIDNPYLPPLDIDATKSIELVVNHNNRTDRLTIDDIAFETGFRPDRVIDPRGAVVIDSEGNKSAIITPDSKCVRVDCRVFRTLDGPIVTLSLVLFSATTRGDYGSRYRDNYTKTVAFRTLSINGEDAEDLHIDFLFDRLDPTLFRRNSVIAALIVCTRAEGYRTASMQEIALFRVGVPPTLTPLSAPASATSSGARRPRPQIPARRLSGRHWCAKFPTSASTASLKQPFRRNIQNFITMLEKNGASVRISATFRPKERAYLMQYAYKIAKQDFDPSRVPKYVGVDIVWDHDNAKAAAEAMCLGYDIAHEPAGPSSKHCLGLAIDMTIASLPDKLTFKVNDKDETFKIGKDQAASNRILWKLGAKYFGVAKLPKDPPHWFSP